MKKLLLALTAFVCMTSVTFAQKKEAPKAKTEKVAPAAGPTKKDGTPDKRYKENKGAPTTAPAGPTKKDGTPDMRYKENKAAAPKKKG
jgi:hypothetical protein